MGRPADRFCWDNVDKLPNSRWRCKHCKEEFSGAGSRIRIHLSGEGTDIGSCEAVPSHVREEALKRASKKRRQNSSLGDLEDNDGISFPNRNEVGAVEIASSFQVPSSNGDLSTHNNKSSEQEYTTDVLVKFFMSRNLPVDVVKDPHFRTFLMRAAQHGFPPCLFRNDLVGIKRSVSNFEHEVNEYLLMVKDSWKTTGCTLICYSLNEYCRGNSLNLETDNDVYGFYCPNGFIFVEGRQLDFSQGFKDALKNHVLNLPIENVTHQITHSHHLGCEFAQQVYTGYDCFTIPCVRQKVEQVWMRICRKTGWVDNLIQKSEKLYHYMIRSPDLHRCEGWGKLMVEKDADSAPMSSFTHLTTIMQLEDGIKEWLFDVEKKEFGIEEIIDNNEFWCDGNELLKALSPLKQIIDDVADTLVPTAGYLQVAIDKAKHCLKPYYEQEALKYQLICQSLFFLDFDPEDGLEGAICAFLSPVYDWQPDRMQCLNELIDREDQGEKLKAEILGYRANNPFANLSSYERKWTHPVELWNKHGGEFPLLRKRAIKMLSQPTSCMCNQVKKHIKQFKGEDNFILRLNYHMMQQFST